jgi:hypothetical protein
MARATAISRREMATDSKPILIAQILCVNQIVNTDFYMHSYNGYEQYNMGYTDVGQEDLYNDNAEA